MRHAAITNALDGGVPLLDAQILARHADPRTTEHYDRARGNLDPFRGELVINLQLAMGIASALGHERGGFLAAAARLPGCC